LITAGKKAEAQWGEGNSIFLDIGFSSNGKTCGLAFGDESTQSLKFGDAKSAIVNHIRKRKGSMNLVIEAPLSVCFGPDGNPRGRRIERKDEKARYWYIGAGCAVMTAAMYLIRSIHEATKDLQGIEIRLFEGFASFKDSGTESNHEGDVRKLREKVKSSSLHESSIYDSGDLKLCETDEICSAFRVAGMDCGVPAVIVV